MAKPTNRNDELKKQIKEQVSILDIASEYGLTPVPKSRGTYTLQEHDSVLIYPKTNSFYRYATDVGGDVLKFMEHMDEINIPYRKAFNILKERVDPTIKAKDNTRGKTKDNKYEKHKGTLAEKQARASRLIKSFSFDKECKNAMAYLIQTRKLDADIVKKLIHENCIKQETKTFYKDKATGERVEKPNSNEMDRYDTFTTRNVVFLGHDEMGLMASGCSRACNSSSTFKGENENTDYSYGWLHDPEIVSCNAYMSSQNYNPNKTLVCFESYIDMVSFMTLLKQQGSDYTQYAYLSCGSATKYRTISAVQDRVGYKSVAVCFDNDEAGKLFTEKIKVDLEAKGVKVKTNVVSKSKDWNSDLQYKSEKGIKKEKQTAQDSIKKEKHIVKETKIKELSK